MLYYIFLYMLCKSRVGLTTLLVLLFIINMSVLTVQARPYLFTTDSSLSLSASPTDLGLISPGTGEADSTLTITYAYGRFARPAGFPLPNRKTPTSIMLAVESSPTWCEVTIDALEFSAQIGSFVQSGSVDFTANISAQIPAADTLANQQGIIVVNVSAAQNGNILSSTQQIELTVTSGFIPAIDYTISNTTFELHPNEQQITTLQIENTGNTPLYVEAKVDHTHTEIFDITIPEPQMLDVDQDASISVTISARDNENLSSQRLHVNVSLDYFAVENHSAAGASEKIPLTIEFMVTAEDEADLIDLAPFVIGIFGAFLVLYLLFWIVSRRRRQA